MSNPVLNDKYWSSFSGVTKASFNLLNEKLEELGLSTLDNLKALASEARNGLFARKKEGNSRVSLLGVDFFKKFLSLSNVKGISGLNLSSSPTLDQLCTEAVKRTTSLAENSDPPAKPATTSQMKAEGPVFTTACGETFDPARCSLLGADSYSQQKVEEFMVAHQLHKPAGANYNRMCDILKAHWIRYMTDMLSDVFMKPSVELNGVELRNMASERGIPVKNKSDQDVVNDLIRWLVDKILTLDALDYGLGEAANQIVERIMSDTLDFKKLTKKQKLAVIMMASRFNRKLMNFVIVDESTDELNKELTAFQKALSNLRAAVKSIPSGNGVKIAAGLAQTVAEAEGKKKETDTKAAAEEAEAPFPTEERVTNDTLEFLSTLKFTNNPSTFNTITRVLELTGYLKTIVGMDQKVHMFLPTDQIMKQFLEKIKKGVEQFSALPTAISILSLLTVVDPNPLQSAIKTHKGKLKAHSGDDIILTHVPETGVIQFETNEGKSRTTINAAAKIRGKISFYSSGLTTGKYTKGLLDSKKTTPQKTSPVKKATPEKKAEGVDVKLPSVSPTKKDVEISACELFIKLFVKRSLTKLGEILFGVNGVLKGSRNNVYDLSDFKLLTKVVKSSKALRTDEPDAGVLQFIYELAIAYVAQTDVNPMFDVQVDLTRPARACRAFDDLLSGKTKAERPAGKAQTSEQLEFPTLNDALAMMNCLIVLQLFQASDTTDAELLDDPELTDIFVFAPTDEALLGWLEDNGQELDFILSEEGDEMRNALLASFISRSDSDDVFKMDDLTQRRPSKNKKNQASFAEGCMLYRIESYETPSGIAEMMDIDYDDVVQQDAEEVVEEESSKFKLPAKGCERIIAMFQELTKTLPRTLADFVAIFNVSPDLELAEARDMFVITLQEKYPGFEEQINDAVTEEMIDYIRVMLISYNQSPATLGKFPFACPPMERLYTGGHAKKVANVDSKFGPTPVPKKESPKKSPPKKVKTPPKEATPPASPKVKKVATPPVSPKSPPKKESPPLHPILKALKSNENLSRTYYIVGLTGFDAIIQSGKVRTLFAPSNDAWDKFGAQFGGIETLLGKSGTIPKFTSLLRYHSTGELYGSDDEASVPTMFISKSVVKHVPLSHQYYGTAQLETFANEKGGVIVIDTVQLDSVVDKMKTQEAKATDPKSGKFGGGTSKYTQGDKFEGEVNKFLAPEPPKPQASPKPAKKKLTLSQTLKANGAHIMADIASKTLVKDGKTLDTHFGSAFTLFAPTDQAFANDIGLDVQETINYYSQTADDFSDLVMRHIIFHASLTEEDLTGYAKRKEAVMMSSNEDEDIDVGSTQGHLYFRGDKRINRLVREGDSVIYLSDVVLTQPRDDEFEEADDDE